MAEAFRNELKRWQKVALKSYNDHGNAATRVFESGILTPELMAHVERELTYATEREDVATIFEKHIKEYTRELRDDN